MKAPDEVRLLLQKRYQNKHREWLSAQCEADWPLVINLDIPQERDAARDTAKVRSWISKWQTWAGDGELVWTSRQWRSLGNQSLPECIRLSSPEQVTSWIGQSARWQRAKTRYNAVVARWPVLQACLGRHFMVLADYDDLDFQRLVDMVAWLIQHPESDLYPRQIPLAGLDTKWLDTRKSIVSELVATIFGFGGGSDNFYRVCGLREPPSLIRVRILCPTLREALGGLGYVAAPVAELASLTLTINQVLIVENLQTGLALPDMPGTVAILALGMHVEVLGKLPWASTARCYYWGDLDTHGFAILNRARFYLPSVRSIMMDRQTLDRFKELWVPEPVQHLAADFVGLTEVEQAVYAWLKSKPQGEAIRLEQERLAWDYVLQNFARTLH